MIEQTLNLLGKLNAAPDAILMLDGDALEINIIRDGHRMTILNLGHYGIDDTGDLAPVAPLLIQITIEKGSAPDPPAQSIPQFAGDAGLSKEFFLK